MHQWASSTKLLTAMKEPRAILLNICFIILYQFIPLMIYRYSSIQCTDFYQLPTASNLQDKKIFLNRPSLSSNIIPLACSRLWDSRVHKIEKAPTRKNLEDTGERRVGLSPFLFPFFLPHPTFLSAFHFCVFPTLSHLPTIYNTSSFKIRRSPKPVSQKWIYWHENKKNTH